MPDVAYKRCSRCGEEKPLEDFYRDGRIADGRYSACKTCHNRGRSNGATPEETRRRTKRYDERYPEKATARWKLRAAVRSGEIVKPKTCEECGGEVALQGHHHDYSKPLDVRWLCVSCHNQRHRS